MSTPSGILWAGPVKDIGGYGNVSRNYLRALQLIGLPLQVMNTGSNDRELGREDIDLFRQIQFQRNTLGNNPVLLIHGQPEAFQSINQNGFNKKIGITLFETDRIPSHWASLCNSMDEIWVPTQFNYRTFTENGVDPSKVKVIHYPIDYKQYEISFHPFPFPPQVKSFRFLYTIAFDFRKELDLLIHSYCEEFSNTEDVSLIIKMYIPDWSSKDDISKVISSFIPAKKDNPHIHFIIGKMARKELLSLYSSSTCYVSTERACGWGMPQMEMMAMGKPVISVNWGGPTEFMNSNNSFLIEPEKELENVNDVLQRLRPDLYLGHKCPKVTKKSVKKILREAFENHIKREQIASQAKRDIQNNFSLMRIAEQIKARLFV